LINITTALYDNDDDVVQLSSANFDRLVTDSDNVWIVSDKTLETFFIHLNKGYGPRRSSTVKNIRIIQHGGIDSSSEDN